MARTYKMRKRKFDDELEKARALKPMRDEKIRRAVELEMLEREIEQEIDRNLYCWTVAVARLIRQYGNKVTQW